jgi:hypothetical protein
MRIKNLQVNFLAVAAKQTRGDEKVKFRAKQPTVAAEPPRGDVNCITRRCKLPSGVADETNDFAQVAGNRFAVACLIQRSLLIILVLLAYQA